MSTPINLNKARKARDRAGKTARGDANAVTFGLSKSQREHAAQENSRVARILDEKVFETPKNSEKEGHEKP